MVIVRKGTIGLEPVVAKMSGRKVNLVTRLQMKEVQWVVEMGMCQ